MIYITRIEEGASVPTRKQSGLTFPIGDRNMGGRWDRVDLLPEHLGLKPNPLA